MLGINLRRSNKKPFFALCAFVVILFLSGQIKTPIGNIQDSLEGERVWTKGRRKAGSHTHARYGLRVLAEQHKAEQLEQHIYRNDGLLQVNPNGPHPIFELIKSAQTSWDRKLERASTTLQEAVDEYYHRYERLPPRGFDDWWAYVQEHNVQLPDEYDQIFNDLEPFWGMNPKELQKIQRDWEAHADSFTVGKDMFDERLSLKNYTFPSKDISPKGLAKGAYEIMELLKDVERSIPSFRAVFSPHDNPNLHTDYELRTQALKAAKKGTFIDIDNPPKAKVVGWISACSPESAARNQHINWGGEPFRLPRLTSKTFIHDHHKSMNPCEHPSHFLLHGQFISHGKGPVAHRTLIPQFSYGPTVVHHDITPAMPINWMEDIYPREDDPDWEDRGDARLQWRGSNTGIWHDVGLRWDLAQRARLVRWAGDGRELEDDSLAFLGLASNITVLMPAEKGKKVGRGMQVQKVRWAPAMVDAAFAGQPANCAPEMCKKLGKIFEYRQRQEMRTAGNYRYYIDVDGNGWSSRFKRLITSQALVFKSTLYPEWYMDRVAPWVHYVPVQVDLSDLWDALAFFRGDPLGNGAHEDMARSIAEAGREWSKTFWRKEDMTAYMFRLFLEYSRVMDPDRLSLSFEGVKPSAERAGRRHAWQIAKDYDEDEDDSSSDSDFYPRQEKLQG